MEVYGVYITGYQLAFIIISIITVGAASMVVLSPNILRAALFLGLVLVGVAGFFVLANAPFLAAIQIMIYVGAIVTMIILAIFLSHRVMNVGFFEAIYNPVFAMGVSFLVFIFLFIVVANSLWIKDMMADGPASKGMDTAAVAGALLQPYVFAFELVSVVLLAVLVGAIVIAKEDN